jgi:hypothetical protein
MRTAAAAAVALAALLGCSRGGARRDPTERRPPWRPAPGTSWQWQLSGTLDTTLDVAMYDVDLFDAPDAALLALRQRGVKIVCYFSAGSFEPERADVVALPPAVIGSALDGWPTERWLDVRAEPVRALARGRLDHAVARGCDGVEPDNVDAFANDSGFALTAADQLAFNRFLAAEAHARGLSIGLKNDVEQAGELVADFDWALVEECERYDECDALAPFVRANKAVFHVEYGDAVVADRVCPAAIARNFDTLIKRIDLDAGRIACREP